MNKTLINIPIEPLEERYSVQWDKWFMEEFSKNNVAFKTLHGDFVPSKIERGSFLDVVHTNVYKTSQLQRVLTILKDYKDDYELILFFHDLWFPGLETIAYIREGLGLKNLKIYGCLHAGSYDTQDFLFKKQMYPWAKHMEVGWFNHIVDGIFVATHFHKKILVNCRVANENKVHVTGFPIYPQKGDFTKKQDIVVFPHRLDEEKQPALFDSIAEMFKDSGWQFIKTKDYCKTKEEYYALLEKSKISISFALQETWGIAMQESLFAQNIPLCPSRLSYKEMYDGRYLYDNMEDLANKLRFYMQYYDEEKQYLVSNRTNLVDSGHFAIKTMLHIMY